MLEESPFFPQKLKFRLVNNSPPNMSSVFFYEPFYNFECLFDEAWSRQAQKTGNQVQRGNGPTDRTVRPIKPRYGYLTSIIKAIFGSNRFPRMDLHEDKEKNLVTASFEFPGVSKENIQIDVHDGKLIVSAETKQSSEHDENGYAIRERHFGKYARTLLLPQGVKVCQALLFPSQILDVDVNFFFFHFRTMK